MKRCIYHGLLLLLFCNGCATLPSPPGEPSAETTSWRESMRALSGHGTFQGVSKEARQIESNLGFK
jgi:hypothetical protein